MTATTKITPNAPGQTTARGTTTHEAARPTNTPPGAEMQYGGRAGTTTENVPMTLSDEELARMMGTSAALVSPTLEPPTLKEAVGAQQRASGRQAR
jgi:hypothetical protein